MGWNPFERKSPVPQERMEMAARSRVELSAEAFAPERVEEYARIAKAHKDEALTRWLGDWQNISGFQHDSTSSDARDLERLEGHIIKRVAELKQSDQAN